MARFFRRGTSMHFLLLQQITGVPETSAMQSTEHLVVAAVQWIRLGVEAIGASIIALGVGLAVYRFVAAIVRRETGDYNQIRLLLARYLALALEFQLGADILSTAVAPSWDQIGKLGAIAVIRTGLNYFLMREMEMERKVDTAPEAPLPRRAEEELQRPP